METKIFGSKKLIIRPLLRKDLKAVKKFQEFINSFIEEDAQLLLNKKLSLKEEVEWLKNTIKNIKKKKEVLLVAEDNGIVVGTISITLGRGRKSHVGEFGITIRNGYRRIGLGKYLTRKIIQLAKKELKPKPKIIRLSVFVTNKPAINLYKKIGFREVAKIPKQIEYQGKLIDEIVMLLYL